MPGGSVGSVTLPAEYGATRAQSMEKPSLPRAPDAVELDDVWRHAGGRFRSRSPRALVAEYVRLDVNP